MRNPYLEDALDCANSAVGYLLESISVEHSHLDEMEQAKLALQDLEFALKNINNYIINDGGNFDDEESERLSEEKYTLEGGIFPDIEHQKQQINEYPRVTPEQLQKIKEIQQTLKNDGDAITELLSELGIK